MIIRCWVIWSKVCGLVLLLASVRALPSMRFTIVGYRFRELRTYQPVSTGSAGRGLSGRSATSASTAPVRLNALRSAVA